MPVSGDVGCKNRTLIDAEPVEGGAETLADVSPATGEVVGAAAHRIEANLRRAIDAVRRTSDETDRSTDHDLGKRCSAANPIWGTVITGMTLTPTR